MDLAYPVLSWLETLRQDKVGTWRSCATSWKSSRLLAESLMGVVFGTTVIAGLLGRFLYRRSIKRKQEPNQTPSHDGKHGDHRPVAPKED